ncbi:hypothetical protein J2T13_001946 [Paenibacillus sp. DS2015]|uniref:DUF2812 domain-containing protein n=1 Tax=Paenibacillus sp. DS2015 TaxID=3373917 RepID=UPI003D246A80
MIKQVFRPFWSYDVNKTEAWLSSMAEKGYYLVKLNRGTRYFYFIKGDPKRITYRIGFNKMHSDSLSKALLDDGWNKVWQSGHWYVLSNEHSFEQIKTSPVREGIIKHNRVIMYIFGSVLIYMTTMAIFFVTIISLVMFSQDEPIRVGEQVGRSPYWFLTYLYAIPSLSLWILSIYSVVKINKTNKKLRSENVQQNNPHEMNSDERRISKAEKKQLKRSGQMIVKRRFGWMYAPDKLEQWLETMEEQGYNLYRMSRTGTVFHFIVGRSRKVSYCADFQNIADKSYNDIHIDSGWKSVFISNSHFQKWTLWSREYSDDEARPQIYSDKSHHVKHARRIAISYTCIFLPLIIVYIFNMGINMELRLDNKIGTLQMLSMISLTLAILTMGSYLIRTWLYCMRLRKRYDYNL